MRFARIGGKWRIKLSPSAVATVRAEKARNAEFGRYWRGILNRLKITAHRDGTPLGEDRPGEYVFASGPDPVSGLPRILVSYLIMGDTVTIGRILIDVPDE